MAFLYSIILEVLALTTDKKYTLLVKQLKNLYNGEKNIVANLANTASVLKQELNLFWVGFYFVEKDENELVLGPFQGPIACTRIPFGKGVCGYSWKNKKSILVPNVHLFEGHIACNSNSKSELVCPIIVNNKVVCILDADSDKINGFDLTDQKTFELICSEIASLFSS